MKLPFEFEGNFYACKMHISVAQTEEEVASVTLEVSERRLLDYAAQGTGHEIKPLGP